MMVFALKLILAHILGDFVLQPDRWVQHKIQHKLHSVFLYGHIAVHAASLLVLLGLDKRYWPAVGIILFTHYVIDLAKLYLTGTLNPRLLFFLDQFAHLLVLTSVLYIYYPFVIESHQPGILLLVTCFLIATVVSAIMMRLLMSKWTLPEDRVGDSLPNAGQYIGILERIFVFGFIVLQQWQAIGFLIAAKSILRFSDLSRAKDRKLTEYVLIGTLLSFSLAISAGLLYLYFNKFVVFRL